MQAAEALLLAGASAKAVDEDGNTPLHLAAIGNAAEVRPFLLLSGQGAGQRAAPPSFARTPPLTRRRLSRLQFLELLIGAGADANARNRIGDTAAHIACCFGHDAFLAEAMPHINCTSRPTQGEAVRRPGSQEGRLPCWQRVTQHRLPAPFLSGSSVDAEGSTPLMSAISHRDLPGMAMALLDQLGRDKGSDREALPHEIGPNIRGDNALHLACYWGNLHVSRAHCRRPLPTPVPAPAAPACCWPPKKVNALFTATSPDSWRGSLSNASPAQS